FCLWSANTIRTLLEFVDEAAFRSDAHRGTTWGKAGDSGGRFGFKLASAVSPRGDLHFDMVDGVTDTEKFIGFLQKLRHDADSPIFVIADNARYHHSNKARAFLDTQPGQIMMAFLPPYPP
ncbi:MAG: transposase, partial [Methylovulum sp.]